MVRQPSHTGASETAAYSSFMSMGACRAQATLTCVAKDRLLWGQEAPCGNMFQSQNT